MNLGSQEEDPIRLADWAELQILYSEDERISLEYIRTELDIVGSDASDDNGGAFDSGQRSERLISQAVREIERREGDAGNGYPFKWDGSSLELRPDVERWNPYVFCLMVCDRDFWVSGDESPKIFEHVASAALSSYLQGDTVRFGSPRDTLPSDIKGALDELSRLTGDPLAVGGFPTQSTDKDLKLDVVGWRNFTDGRASKVLVYMQCATGENWEGKKTELDLSAGSTWNQIMHWTIPPVKALAIPYIVSPGDEWRRVTTGILLFDRLRICSLLSASTAAARDVDWSEWCETRVSHVQVRQRP